MLRQLLSWLRHLTTGQAAPKLPALNAAIDAIYRASSIAELNELTRYVEAQFPDALLDVARYAIATRAVELIRGERSRHTMDERAVTPIDPDEPDADGERVIAHQRASRGYDVLLRAIPLTTSVEELMDIRALAAAQYAGRMFEEIEAAIEQRLARLAPPR